MMLDISLGLGLCCSPREVYSNTSEGIHHHWQQQQQSKSKQAKNFFMSFSVVCRQKVWPRLRVNFPTSNDPVKRSQLICFIVLSIIWLCFVHLFLLMQYILFCAFMHVIFFFFSVCYSCVFLKAACLPWIALVCVCLENIFIFHQFWHSSLSWQCLLLGLEIYHSMVSWPSRLLIKT